jgi:transposase-like protein
MNTRLPSLPPAPPTTLICPSCGHSTRQNRAGFNKDAAGCPRSQRYECQHCGRTHTPAPRHHGYDPHTRRLAVQQYVDGTNLRRIARLLGVAPQSVVNWVDKAHARLPSPPTTREARLLPPAGTLELDEVYTFVGEKKSPPSS